MLFLNLPIHAISEANSRDHWAKKAKRVADHLNIAKTSVILAIKKNEVDWMVERKGKPKRAAFGPFEPKLPIEVTITRVGQRKMDSDNLASSLKATRDGIAQALGIDDGDEKVCIW